MPMKKSRSAAKPGSREEKEILGRLTAGLSGEEIRRVLAGACSN